MSNLLYKYVFSNYFLYFAFFAFLDMFSIHFFNTPLLFDIVILFLAVQYFKKGMDILDIWLLFTILIIILTSLPNTPLLLFRNGLEAEILPMFAYFIGKNDKYNNDELLRKGKVVLCIVGFIGLFLFVLQPGWYVSFRLASTEGDLNSHKFLEMTRLSAFWEFPYWISYGTAIIYTYILKNALGNKGCPNTKEILLLFYFFMIALLTQQRAAIGMIIMSTVLLLWFYGKINLGRIILSCIFIVLLLLIIKEILDKILSLEQLDFLLSKFTDLQGDDNTSFLQKRANLFSDFIDKPISLFGDGLGIYGHAALRFGKDAITDQGYLKILYETGVFGFFSRLFFILIIFLRGIRKRNKYIFESLIIFFIMIAMLGANPLSNFQMHNIVFWLCCGNICSDLKKRKLKTVKYEQKNNCDTSASVLPLSRK